MPEVDATDPMVMINILTTEGWIKWLQGEELKPEDYIEGKVTK